MGAFLQNTVTTFQETFTLLHALYSLPPAVIDNFWKLTDLATAAEERAKALDGAGRRHETLLLVLALSLYRDALKDATITDADLEKRLSGLRFTPEPALQNVLLKGGYFHEITRLMMRLVEYSRKFLRHYDSHPAFVMDLNMLLNSVERLSGYTPSVPFKRRCPYSLEPGGKSQRSGSDVPCEVGGR